MKNKKTWIVIFIIGLMAGVVFLFYYNSTLKKDSVPFYFSGSGNVAEEIIEEVDKMKNSENSDWWLNSGGILRIKEKEFSTNIGKIEKASYWRKLYAKNNPTDTDDGYYPQNLFRLVTKGKWKNFSQSVYFKIENINLSESKNRNESNGVFLFNRYQDGDNLYYTGVRVDGDVVIKKKIDGKYYTMAEKKLFEGDAKYNREENPSLIPEKQWIGIKSELSTDSFGRVDIKLFVDKDGDGNWELALEKIDAGDKYGGKPIKNSGYAGIRTDFMDVAFRDYEIR